MLKLCTTRWLFPIVSAAILGCDDTATHQAEPPVATAKALHSPAEIGDSTASESTGDPSATTTRNFDGAIFQVPGAWKETPRKSEFITAEFQVSGSGGPARLTLSTAGGRVEDNLERWRGQFASSPSDPPAKQSMLTVDGREATLVELFGTFRDSFGGGEPKPQWAMLGAVIPLKQTNYFVKLTGPQNTLAEARDAWIKFVETAEFTQ